VRDFYVLDDSMLDIKNVLATLHNLLKCCTESECWMGSRDRKKRFCVCWMEVTGLVSINLSLADFI
jgi:hypothetical protein